MKALKVKVKRYLRSRSSSRSRPPSPNPSLPLDTSVQTCLLPQTKQDADAPCMSPRPTDVKPAAAVTIRLRDTAVADTHGPIGQKLWMEALKRIEDNAELSPLLAKYLEYLNQVECSDGQVHPDLGNSESQMRQVQQLAQKKLELLTKCHFSFQVGSKTVVVRDQIRRVVGIVSQFKDIISAAIQSEPHAGLAWAGVMLVIPILDTMLQQDAHAAEGFEHLMFLLTRYRLIEIDILSHLLTEPIDTARRTLLSSVESKMIEVYTNIYVYQIRIILQYNRSKLHRLSRDAVTADGWTDIVKRVDTIDTSISSAVRQLSESFGKEKMNTISAKVEEVKTLQLVISQDVKIMQEDIRLRDLPCAHRALFDSDEVRKEGICLPGTQTRVLDAIQSWAEDPDGKLIFWLHGMAGTGKTSIARTVAEALNSGLPFGSKSALSSGVFLGASFFFRRFDTERNKASIFLPTVATSLAERVPGLRRHVAAALEREAGIAAKSREDQMDRLVLKPLLALEESYMLAPMRLVVVVDALDECTDENAVGGADQRVSSPPAKELLRVLGHLERLQHVQVRILILSRRETFMESVLPSNICLSTELQKVDIPRIDGPIEDDDITKFLKHERHCLAVEHSLPGDWMSDDELGRLRDSADGLFIHAATACRFLDEAGLDDESRKERLDIVLQGVTEEGSPTKRLYEIYLSVLEYPGRRLRPREKDRLYARFKRILGTIALVLEPIPVSTLSGLLKDGNSDVIRDLEQLRSVVYVPADPESPLQFLHLSFRDFLLQAEERDTATGSADDGELEKRRSPFRVDTPATQLSLFQRTMDIMEAELCQDICKLQVPGVFVSEIPQERIRCHISQVLQYSSRFWVNHLTSIVDIAAQRKYLGDDGRVHQFLLSKLLYWLEVLSLIRQLPSSVHMINHLRALQDVSVAPQLSAFLGDAWRFLNTHRRGIEQAPMQLYISAIMFSPTRSLVRQRFAHHLPPWIKRLPTVPEGWGLEWMSIDNTRDITCIALSPVASILASGHEDGTTKLWDLANGVEILRFGATGNIGDSTNTMVKSLAFSLDGKKISVLIGSSHVQLRSAETGNLLSSHDAEAWGLYLIDVAIASTNGLLASGLRTNTAEDNIEYGIVKVETGHAIHIGPGAVSRISQDGSTAVIVHNNDVVAYDIRKLQSVEKWRMSLPCQWFPVMKKTCVSVSADGSRVALEWQVPKAGPPWGHTSVVEVWNIEQNHREFHVHNIKGSVIGMAFSPKSHRMVMIVLGSGQISIYDTHVDTNGAAVSSFLTGGGWLGDLALSADGTLVAARMYRGTVQVWKPEADEPNRWNDAERGLRFSTIEAIRNHDQLLLVHSRDRYEARCYELISYRARVHWAVDWATVSPDGAFVLFLTREALPGSLLSLEIWDTCLSAREPVTRVQFDGLDADYVIWSEDNESLAVVSKPIAEQKTRMIRFLQRSTWEETITLQGIADNFDVSPNLHLLIYSSRIQPDGTGDLRKTDPGDSSASPALTHHLVDVPTGDEVGCWKSDVAARYSRWKFAPDGESAVASLENKQVVLFNTKSGEQHNLWKGRFQCFDNTGKHMLLARYTGGTATFTAIYTATGSIAFELEMPPISGVLSAVAISPAGLVAVRAQSLFLWNGYTGQHLGQLDRDSSSVISSDMCFSPDARYLSATGNKGRLPLPSSTTGYDPLGPIAEDTEDCLYVDSPWIRQGAGRLIWLPFAFRPDYYGQYTIGREVVVISPSGSRLIVIDLDLANTPLVKRKSPAIAPGR